MDHDSLFMHQALVQARLAQLAGEVPVGAVVVKDGQVLGVGRNAPIGQHDPTAHAEVMALRAAALTLGNYRLDGCTLYVTLEPCPMCAGAILHSRIQRVVFGAPDPKTGAAGSAISLFSNQQLNHQTEVAGGVLAEESADMLRMFFQERRHAHARQAQPLRDDALRTPDSAFVGEPVDAEAPRYFCDDGYTCGWRMHYVDNGVATAEQTLLLLHDLPGSSADLRPLVGALTPKGMRVIAPDLIGFGRSDKPKKTSVHALAMHLYSLQGLVKHLAPTGLVIAGEGAGADIASVLAGALGLESAPMFGIRPAFPRSLDMRPYPDRGYQAGLRAVASLIAEIAQARGAAGNRVSWLDGPAEDIAKQIGSDFTQRIMRT